MKEQENSQTWDNFVKEFENQFPKQPIKLSEDEIRSFLEKRCKKLGEQRDLLNELHWACREITAGESEEFKKMKERRYRNGWNYCENIMQGHVHRDSYKAINNVKREIEIERPRKLKEEAYRAKGEEAKQKFLMMAEDKIFEMAERASFYEQAGRKDMWEKLLRQVAEYNMNCDCVRLDLHGDPEDPVIYAAHLWQELGEHELARRCKKRSEWLWERDYGVGRYG